MREPKTSRKAAARRLAEAGCTVHEIAAITGHTTLKEVERYTKAVDRERPYRCRAAKERNELSPFHRADPKPKDHREYSRSGPCIAAKAVRACPIWVIFVRPKRLPPCGMSALPPKADIERTCRDVRFVPIADSCTAANEVHGVAMIYSITSSMRPRWFVVRWEKET